MKILHVVPGYFPALKYGGPVHSVYLLNNSLAKNGGTVDVITCNVGLRDHPDIPTGKWIQVEGTRVMYLPFYGYEHYTLSPQLLWTVLKEVKKYDIVHITAVWNFPVFAASLASFIYRKPFIISPRGTIYKETIELKSTNKKWLYYYFLAKHYIRRAAALHFTTEDEQVKVTDFLKLKTPSFVVANGLDLNEFANMPQKGSFFENYPTLKNKKYLLFLSRIHPKKGLDILIEAFAKVISQDFNDLFLVIAGPDDPYRNELEKLIEDKGIGSKVIFTGMLTGQDKLAAFQDAEWMVLSSYSENFGMVVVESLACGTPVIISDQVGLHQEISKSDSGIVVKAEEESVIKGIKQALSDNNLRERMAQNGKDLVKRFYDVDAIGARMLENYESILTKRKR